MSAYCENSLANSDLSSCLSIAGGTMTPTAVIQYCEAQLGLNLTAYRTTNLALNKPATQSTTYPGTSASRAVCFPMCARRILMSYCVVMI